MFHELDAGHILATSARLRDRIRERFPDASLARVADHLVEVARTNAARSAAIRRPNHLLRGGGVLAFAATVVVIALGVHSVHPEVGDRWHLYDLLQAVEAGLGSLVFLGAAFVFVWTLDVRSKRRRCLEALHELRAMAHIIDMHQLTKDPDRLLHAGPDTRSSPARTLGRFELARYLDYCSEMLSLIGKVAALYVQGFPDPVALGAVDDIEDLTTSLSRKMWQKIVMLEQAAAAPAAQPGAAAAPTPAPVAEGAPAPASGPIAG